MQSPLPLQGTRFSHARITITHSDILIRFFMIIISQSGTRCKWETLMSKSNNSHPRPSALFGCISSTLGFRHRNCNSYLIVVKASCCIIDYLSGSWLMFSFRSIKTKYQFPADQPHPLPRGTRHDSHGFSGDSVIGVQQGIFPRLSYSSKDVCHCQQYDYGNNSFFGGTVSKK